jgi:hypothetical protein
MSVALLYHLIFAPLTGGVFHCAQRTSCENWKNLQRLRQQTITAVGSRPQSTSSG